MASNLLSRRKWTLLMGSAPFAASLAPSLSAQVATPPSPQQPSPEQRKSEAVADMRKVSDTLAALEIPMSIEPAFAFKP